LASGSVTNDEADKRSIEFWLCANSYFISLQLNSGVGHHPNFSRSHPR
jgi:hypothetical protein